MRLYYCNLTICKHNQNGQCNSKNFVACPKNNEQSIFEILENPDLLKETI